MDMDSGRPRDEVIAELDAALDRAGLSRRAASLRLNLNHSYLSEFMQVQGYSPEVLPEDVRYALAQLVGLDEKKLRIALRNGGAVNEGEAIQSYSRRVNRSHESRDANMRIDELLIEIGRIKERLDRLETGRPNNAGKPTSRP